MPSKAKQAPVSTAAPYTLQMLPVGQVRVLAAIQPRVALSEEVIEEYATLYREAEGEDCLPAIDVFQVEGTHYVSDGFHRLEAAKRARRTDLACHVYTGSEEAAMRHGIFANLRRGLAYTQNDRQRILERLLQDPEVSQRSDRALARDLGLSHVTVGRARHRLAAVATLEAQWRAVPVTQPQDEARRQEQIATFLEVEPAVVESYEKLRRSPLDESRVISSVARRMTDSHESEADAKAGVRHQLHKEVREWEQVQGVRYVHDVSPPQETPEELTQRSRAFERGLRQDALFQALRNFTGLLAGSPLGSAGPSYTIPEMVEALTAQSRSEVFALLSQAEAVIGGLKDALAVSLVPAAERPGSARKSRP